MAIHIEIGKSYTKGLWRIRIGDVDGCSRHSNIEKEEVLKDIEDKMDEEKEK